MQVTDADLVAMATGEAKRTRFGYANVDVTVESITPLYDNLLVRRLYDEERVGLIVSPDLEQTIDGRWVRKADTGPRRGLVVAAGPGDRTKTGTCECAIDHPFRCHLIDCDPVPLRKSMSVKVGDVIIYPRFESTHIKIGDEQYTFVHEADVMAVLED